MILLFDIGNSRLKWRLLDGEKAIADGGYNHRGGDVDSILAQQWGTLPIPSAIWGVSVASHATTESVVQWCRMHWSRTPQLISSSPKQVGITNGYKEPSKLGADRWTALLGAGAVFSGACCIADCGTAVTVDCLDAQHHHLGGLIIPGLELMPRCVAANTANVEQSYREDVALGRDTSGCLVAGALHAITGALEHTASFLESKCGSPVHRVITGGDAERLLPLLGKDWCHVPDLIFIGILAAIKSSKDNE